MPMHHIDNCLVVLSEDVINGLDFICRGASLWAPESKTVSQNKKRADAIRPYEQNHWFSPWFMNQAIKM